MQDSADVRVHSTTWQCLSNGHVSLGFFGVMRGAPLTFICFIYAILKGAGYMLSSFLLRLLWNPAWEA